MVEPVVRVRYDYSLITDDDLYIFNEGSHFRLYEKLGAHRISISGEPGVYFAVWESLWAATGRNSSTAMRKSIGAAAWATPGVRGRMRYLLHQRSYSLNLLLPPLAVCFFKQVGDKGRG